MLERLPETKDEQQRALSKMLFAFQAADEARAPRKARWLRWYELYSAYAEAEDRSEDNWRSKVFIPAVFYVVETVAPRLVAQLPKPIAKPVEEADVPGAKAMEETIRWATEVTDLYVQLVAAMKDALIYGTGFLKTFADERSATELVTEDVMEDVVADLPVMDPETGQVLRDPDGKMVTEQKVIGQRKIGQRTVSRPYTYYRGPAAEAVDPFNFWFAPEASNIDDARWVIHREFMSRPRFEKLVADGYYRKPEHMSDGDFYAFVDDPRFERYAAVGLGGAQRSLDPDFDAVELLEFWTDDRKVCVANRVAVVAAEPNPFNHGQKPFVRLVDHFVAHEPYGIGEVQMLEGLQDEVNALVNSRIDAVKLAMHLMLFVDEDALVDTSDLRIRPGGRIRVRNRYGLSLDQVIKRVDFGEVTNSAYVEVQEAMQAMERISGTSGPPGPEDPAVYRTATGVVNVAEGMQARYAHKLKMMELTGIKRLFTQFGVLLQQFVDRPMSRRVLGEGGGWEFIPVTPESIQGRFDIEVEAESSAVTESVKREQEIFLYQTLGSDPMVNRIPLLERILQRHGIKDTKRFIASPAEQILALMQQLSPQEMAQVHEVMMQATQQMMTEEASGGQG